MQELQPSTDPRLILLVVTIIQTASWTVAVWLGLCLYSLTRRIVRRLEGGRR